MQLFAVGFGEIGQALAVKDVDYAPLDGDHPFVAEFAKGAGEGLADRTEPGRQLTLGNRQLDLTFLRGSEFHEVEGEAGGDILEGQFLDLGGKLTQETGEATDHVDGDLGVLPQQVEELALGEKNQAGFDQRLGISRIESVPKNGGLGKSAAWMNDVQDTLFPLRGEFVDFDATAGDDKKTGRRLSFGKKLLSLVTVAPSADLQKSIEVVFGDTGKEWATTDDRAKVHEAGV